MAAKSLTSRLWEACFKEVPYSEQASSKLAIALVVIAEIVVATWLGSVVTFQFQAIHNYYGFEPMPVGVYTTWATAAETVVPLVLLPLTCVAYAASHMRVTRWLAYVVCMGFAAFLISGNILGNRETTKRLAFKEGFATKFNSYYCSARTLRRCLQGTDEELLVMTHQNASTTVQPLENVTEAGLAIFSRCHQVLRESIAKEAAAEDAEDSNIQVEGEIEVDLRSFYTLLDDCNNSRPLDAWCGGLQFRATPLSGEEHVSLPSAFAYNPGIFHRYTREWPKRMLYTNIFLGSAIGCVLSMALYMKSRKAWRRAK